MHGVISLAKPYMSHDGNSAAEASQNGAMHAGMHIASMQAVSTVLAHSVDGLHSLHTPVAEAVTRHTSH